LKNHPLIGPVPEDPAEALANWRSVRERVHDRFDQAKSEPERVELLALYCATMNLAEKAIAPADLEKFREIRGHGYSLLVVKECLQGDVLSKPKAESVMARELAAGRMASDHVLRNPGELARQAMEYVRTRRLVQEHANAPRGPIDRLLSWLHR
jgi:hypothetical protein